MLKVTIDLFSGRPNPTWIVTSEETEAAILGAVSQSTELFASPGAGFNGLGYREVIVARIDDDQPQRTRVPYEFALATTAAANVQGSGQLAQQLVEAMMTYADIRLPAHIETPLTPELRDYSLEQLLRFLRDPPRPIEPVRPPRTNPLRTTVRDGRCDTCLYEVSQYNPAFWNRTSVQPYNNCYNYSRNWRTDTFAQPGRAHGAPAAVMACANVTNAALADGLHRRCDCLPQSEYPRRHMALVVAPGFDYHWYREQRGGFWGHKPGGTAARNYDNAGNLVVNPETCARGPYTDFCAYFYAGRSVVIS